MKIISILQIIHSIFHYTCNFKQLKTIQSCVAFKDRGSMLHVDISSLIRPTEGIVPGMNPCDVIEGVILRESASINPRKIMDVHIQQQHCCIIPGKFSKSPSLTSFTSSGRNSQINNNNCITTGELQLGDGAVLRRFSNSIKLPEPNSSPLKNR